MTPIEQLKAVLCDLDGNVCIAGSQGDRDVIQEALKALERKTSEDEAFIIWYEDSQKDPLIFTGYGAKEAAFKKFELIGQRWNATLFSKVRQNWCTCHFSNRVACDVHPATTQIEGQK